MSVHAPSIAIIFLLAYTHTSRALIEDVVDVLKFGKEIGEDILSSWDIIGKPFNSTGGVALPVVSRKERQILARLNLVLRSIDRLELSVQNVGAVATMLAKKGNKPTGLELSLHELGDLLNRVSVSNRQMREYVGLQEELEKSTLQNFAEWCVSHDPGALPGLLERIHSLVVPPHKHLLGQGVLQMLTEHLKGEDSDVCDLQMSPHQLIYDMYNTIALTEIKGYAMMQFSWMLLRIYGRGNFTQEASLTRQRYAERTGQTATAARSALAMAQRDLYRCEPSVYTSDSYAEVTRLLQGFIENEVNMNTESTCKENCAYYTLAESYKCYDESMYCAKQSKCGGRIIDCQYFDSDMWVCPASEKSHRRYEWIEYENGRTLGKVGTCTLGTTKVDSWWRWTLTHCSYCLCLCEDEPKLAERFFSLREAVADIEKNKVVTGIRLVKIKRVFHLQIHQGTLGERGFVEASEEVKAQPFDPSNIGVREGVDYHQLTYEKRAIDLDELDSPDGHVLTGARFSMIGAHLHFEIRSTPFNYTTGKLSPERSQWISNDNTEGSNKPRSRLQLYKPDIPTRGHTPQHIDSQHDQYIEFTNTDFDADAAQSTVPFIDTQPVLPSKALNTKGATLNSGAGVYHRGARGSGGFIGIKLRTYNYSKHVQAEPPPNEFAEDVDTTEFTPIVN